MNVISDIRRTRLRYGTIDNNVNLEATVRNLESVSRIAYYCNIKIGPDHHAVRSERAIPQLFTLLRNA